MAMDLYLPIAGLSVNVLVIIGLGGLVGFLSGMFGVGGGFLTTPLLMFYGIPPAVAVASAATQVTGSSVSGAITYWQRKSIDLRMGWVLVAGGVIGSFSGSFIIKALQQIGQIDLVISLLYVVLLGTVGGLMLYETLSSMISSRNGTRKYQRPRHNRLVAALPFRWRFYRSGVYISPLAPLILGFFTGILTVILGVGGGFIIVPAMIYLLNMPASVVVGTSLFQILFVTAATTMVHSIQSHTVDIVLAALLLIGGVIGAQLGARMALKMKPEHLRLGLALIVLAVAVRMALGLGYRPDEIFTIYGADA